MLYDLAISGKSSFVFTHKSFYGKIECPILFETPPVFEPRLKNVRQEEKSPYVTDTANNTLVK